MTTDKTQPEADEFQPPADLTGQNAVQMVGRAMDDRKNAFNDMMRYRDEIRLRTRDLLMSLELLERDEHELPGLDQLIDYDEEKFSSNVEKMMAKNEVFLKADAYARGLINYAKNKLTLNVAAWDAELK